MTRLIAFEQFAASLRQTPGSMGPARDLAQLRGLGPLDLKLADIDVNVKDPQARLSALLEIARRPEGSEAVLVPRVIAYVLAGELMGPLDQGREYRTQALALVQQMPYTHERTICARWVESMRFLHHDRRVRVLWETYRENLHWLIAHGQRDSPRLVIDYVGRMVTKRDIHRADDMLRQFFQHVVPLNIRTTVEESRELVRLQAEVNQRLQ